MAKTPTFKDILAETEAARIKSDLQNLASAHVMLTENIIQRKQNIAAMEALQAEIEEAGVNPNITLKEVRALYDRAHKIRGEF